MKIGSKTLSLFLAASIISTATFASSLEGAFKGDNSRTVKSDDVMALILQKDQNNADNYYALLAEYTRDAAPITDVKRALKLAGTTILNRTEKTALTRWIPRMYAYYMKKVTDLEYSLHTIRVSQDGELSSDAEAAAILTLGNANSIIGANLKRSSDAGVEEIKFHAPAVSTWEDYVEGNFFGSKDSTGGDYFDTVANMSISEKLSSGKGIVTYGSDDENDKDGIEGEFEIAEKHPRIFTLTAKGANNKGNEKVTGKIGVFVDIVNWKSFGIPKFTTEEFLLINPENPADVGFYYERH